MKYVIIILAFVSNSKGSYALGAKQGTGLYPAKPENSRGGQVYWEGFLRSLASDIWAGVGALFMIAILYSLIANVVKRSRFLDTEKRAGQMRVLRIAAGLIVAFVVVALFGRAASVAFANRVPRQDVDKNPVYEQMDSHGQKDGR